MTEGLIHKLMSVLEGSLSKLGRYDEGSLIGSLMSFAVRSLKFIHRLTKSIVSYYFHCRMYLDQEKMLVKVT